MNTTNLSAISGDSARWNGVVTISGAAQPFSAIASMVWTIRDKARVAVLTKTIGSGIEVTDGPHGLFAISLTPSETLGLSTNPYTYTLVMTDISGAVTTIASGNLVVETL
jgi:hypothetical protein